jgi:predicted MFS family arabinose efflux permease
MDSNRPTPDSNRRWRMFAVAYLCLVAFAFVFQALPPVLRLILEELGLDHTRGGLLMGLFALPGIFLSIPGGWLADRYGVKYVSAVSLVVMIAGTIVSAMAPGFWWLAAGRLVSGVGAMVLIVAVASLITNTFSGRELGTAMGLYNTGVPLGIILTFAVLTAVGVNLGWRPAVLSSAGISLLALAAVLWQLDGSRPDRPPSLKNSLADTGGLIWLVGLVWLWFNAAAISFVTFGPDYFASLNYSPAQAAFLVSLLMWGALVVSPAIGPFMAEKGRKELFIVGGAVLPAAIYLAAPSLVGVIVPLMVLLGLVTALLPAPLFALPAEIVRPERQGMAFGIMSGCLNVGVLLGPLLVGLARDRTGSYEVGFALMAGFSALAALTTVVFVYLRRGAPGR